MPRTLTIHLSGPAEQFVERMISQHHLTDRDVIGKALGLLQVAVDTGRVALMKPTFSYDAKEEVEYFYSLEPNQTRDRGGEAGPTSKQPS